MDTLKIWKNWSESSFYHVYISECKFCYHFLLGRRGGRRSGGPAHNGFPRTPTNPAPAPVTTYSAEISHREVRHEQFDVPRSGNRTTPSSAAGYRTQLGQSSMI